MYHKLTVKNAIDMLVGDSCALNYDCCFDFVSSSIKYLITMITDINFKKQRRQSCLVSVILNIIFTQSYPIINMMS